MIIICSSQERFNELKVEDTFKTRLSPSTVDEEPFQERNNEDTDTLTDPLG